MKNSAISKYILIDEYSASPKYLQLTNSILNAIETGKIGKDYLLPSINELSYQLEISRDTVEKGYKHLKKLGVVNSVPGKGYYISNTDFRQKLRIFLLFNKLSAHKKLVYDAFVSKLGEGAAIDFYIYNNDFKLFRKLLEESKGDYSHYVIIPHFLEGGERAHEVINAIPKDKLILLDKKIPGITGDYCAAYENFEKDIYGALDQARDDLSRYHTLKIIFPKHTYYPVEILKGFQFFCQQYAFNHQVVDRISSEPIKKGEVYINLMEDDLVTLLERIMELGLKVGQDVGVISYNETPLKKVILNGITTISTDFKYMGTVAAGMVMHKEKKHHEIPFYYTHRASL